LNCPSLFRATRRLITERITLPTIAGSLEPVIDSTCAERSIKRKKLDFGLDHTRIAGRERWFFRVMLAAMCQHLDAWSTHGADH
jgi:hypothetical protein